MIMLGRFIPGDVPDDLPLDEETADPIEETLPEEF